MNHSQKKHRNKMLYIAAGLIILTISLVFFTRHLHPTPNKPTYETLTLLPYNSGNTATQTNSQTNDEDSAPITSIPAAEAWVLNLNATH